MTLTISQCFDLPAPDDITALGFVVRLRESGDEAMDRQLVSDYVLTPAVARELPVILQSMAHAQKARSDLGRFVHGSFGSGKSHFLSFLGLLLENREVAWSKDDATIRDLGATHRAWLGEANLLVVRLHMLTTSGGRETGLDRAVFDAANAALIQRKKEPFEFLHVEGVLAEARREAELYGAQFWKRLEEAGIIGSKSEFEAQASASAEDREFLARAYLTWKGRDVASAGVDPNWADGLQRLSTHVKSQGYGGIVLLVDEFLLWLREKSGPDFERAINQLNILVDHADGARAVPLYAFVARQRNIEEFFPDLVEDQKLHEHLGHHAKRFEVTSLEDVELRHVCKGRVLKRRPEHDAEVQRTVDTLAKDNEKLLPSILHGADISYLRDVYPFHPALIEMLIDISSLMQRDRTALRLLYELLVIHYPTLPLGKLLPVGCAFEAIFPEVGVEGSKRVEDLRAIHRVYYQRFRPAMAQMLRKAATDGGDFDEDRRRVLDTVVKTVLLAEVSPRLRGTVAMSVERLVRLNDAEVTATTERSKFNRVYQDLLDLSRLVDLQLAGNGKDATVMVVLKGPNFGEILERARGKVAGNKHALTEAFYKVLLPALGLKRADLGGDFEIKWNETRRRGSVAVVNVRGLANADFKPKAGHEFKLLLDYPWDEPGFTVADDVSRAHDVRKRDGTTLTMCWLPRHLTPTEQTILQDLAALDELLGLAQEELLRDLAPHERQQVLDQAQNQAQNLRQNLSSKLAVVYRDHGQLVAFSGKQDPAMPGGELGPILKDRLAQMLFDQQYSMHPSFKLEPKPEALKILFGWLARAAERPDQGEPFNEEEGKVLQGIGVPLELVQLGQTRASLRLDTRYIKTVRDDANKAEVIWDPIDRRLQDTYALPVAVRNLLLAFLIRIDSFRAQQSVHGDPIEVTIDSKPHTNVKLVRAPLLDLATWSRAREVGPLVLSVTAPSGTRTLAEQDRYATDLRKVGTQKRSDLLSLHERLMRLAPAGGRRFDELKTAIARLAPLTVQTSDSFAVLRDWLALWPDDASDPIRATLLRSGTVSEALDALDETARYSLEHAAAGAHAVEVQALQASLGKLLAAGEQERPLKRADINAWNQEARDLLKRILEIRTPPSAGPTPVPPPPLPPPPPPPPPPPTGKTLLRQRIKPGDKAAVQALAQRLVAILGDLRDDEIELVVLTDPDRQS